MAYTEEQLKAFATTLGQPRTPPELVDASLTHEPATVARDLSLSQRTGIDPAMAGDYADSIARSDIQKAYDDLAVSAPRSHAWTSQDAYNMALMRDSMQQAQLIEGYLHQQKQEEEQDAAVSAKGMIERAGDIATGAWVSAGSILPRTASGLFGAQRAFTEAFIEPTAKAALSLTGQRKATPISDFFKERQDYYGKMADELGGVAGEQLQAGGVTTGVVGGFQMLGQVGAMLAAPQAALPTMAASVFGEEYGAARDKGKDVISSVAFGAGQGAIEYGTEKFAIGKFIEAAKAGKPLAKAAVEMAAKEIPGEQLATFFQDLNTAAVLNPDRPMAEFWEERPNAAMQTLVATLIGGGGAVTVSTAMDAIAGRLDQNVNALAVADQEKRMDTLRAATAESSFNRLKSMAEAADSAPIRGLHDGKFREWIESAARESDLAEVYVNGAMLRDMLAENGITGEQLKTAAPEVAAQIDDALATNGDVRIALPELLSSTFDAKLRDALMPHVKTDPQGMTYQESQGYFQTQVQELEARAQQIAEETAPVQTREEYESDQAMLTTEADIFAEGQAAIEELTTIAASGAATPEQVAELATLQDIAAQPDALAQYFGKTITGEAPKSYDEYLAAHSNTAEVRAREVSGLRNDIVASMRSMNRFPDSVVSAYATPLTEFYLTQSAALRITPSELRKMLPLSFTAESLMGGYTQARKSFKEFAVDYANSLPVDTYENKRQIDELTSEIINDWSNGNSNRETGVFGPDEIHAMLREESEAKYYDADGDLTIEGGDRYTEIEYKLANDAARKYVGEPLRPEFELSRPENAAKVIHAYLESQGLDVSAISGSGKSQSKYFEIMRKGGNVKVRISDHEIPSEYEIADEELRLFDVLPDSVRDDGRNESVGIDAEEATARASTFAEYLVNKYAHSGYTQADGLQPDLYVAHNLSADNLRHAAELGGLAAPSLAVGRLGMGTFDSFGEITLLADKSLLESAKARTFDADVYTPRHPRAEYVIDYKRFEAFLKNLVSETKEAGSLRMPALDDLSRGPDDLLYSDALKYYFLKGKGKAPKPKAEKVAPWIKKAAALGLRGAYSIENSPEFEAILRKHLEAEVKRLSADPELADRAQEFADGWFKDGAVESRTLRDNAWKVARYVEEGGIDSTQMRSDIQKAFRNEKVAQEFQDYTRNTFNNLKTGARLFKGFTDSGNRRYADYTLDNVVREMTQAVKGGEGFNYGAGNLRAMYANEMKTVKQVQARREQIIDKEAFAKIKDESQQKLSDALDALRPFYKYDASSFGYLDDASSAIGEGPKGWREAFEMNDESRKIITDLVDYLHTLPTEYFETKIGRAVSLSEFNTALVPKGVAADVVQILTDAGLKVETYKDANDRARLVGKQSELLFQEGAAPKGAQPRAYFDPATLTISILQGADLSSVLHESGHFYLEALRTMVDHPNAPQLMKDDWAKTLKWFGVADTATWDAMSLDEKRQYHEQWAQSQERWMLEGKSPTLEMQPVFARFRSWLLNVYKSLEEFLRKNPLAGRLDDEMRGVFSRLIASDEAIKDAERSRGYASLFPDAESAGVPEAEFAKYLASGESATNHAIDAMQQRSIKDMQWQDNAKNKALKALQREANAKRKEIRAEVTAEVMAEPVNQARTFLRNGETTDPTTGERLKAEFGAKLNIAEVKDLFTTSAMPNMRMLTGMTAEDGLSPELVAQMFGFRSGESLVLELIESPKAEEKIAVLTDRRMLERHGELIDPASIELAANSAINNEARARHMATGLQMLTKSPMPVREMVRAATEAAQNTIARKKVRDLRPKQFEAAEARANKKALIDAPRDPAKAAEAQRAALLNNRMARASIDAIEEVEKSLRYIAKFKSEGTRKNLDIEYLEQIDDLLAPFDMRTGQSLKTIDKRKSLTEWIAKQESLGYEPAIDVDTAEEAKRKHYKDMTIEEMRGLLDAVKSVEHLGRLKKKLLTAKDKREFAERIQEAIASLEANANRTVAEMATPSDVTGKVGKWYRSMLASHRKFASIIREMDGSQDNGVMWNLLVRSMNEAGDNETTMKAQATEKVAELFQPVMSRMGGIKANLKAQRRVVPNTNLSMTYEERIMFALNWGNEGNRQRLLDGGLSGKRSLSQADAAAVLGTLDKADWDFVQGIWDFVGSYKTQIAEQERRLTGKDPEWVEASPIVTKFGTYAGGYFPAKYDADLSTRSEVLEAATNLRMGMKGAFGSAATSNGYTKQRAEEVVGRPLLLSFNAITTHVNEVVHRLAWQDWLLDANRVIRALDGPVRDYYGTEILKELRETVKDIAQGDAPATTPVEQAINRLRTGSTIVGMGWRVTTALLQPSGLAQSWVRVGGPWMAKGIARYVASPFETSTMVNEKSALMRDRGRTMYREINEIMNTVRVGEKMTALHASYFGLIAKLQRTVDIPTWLGAYEKAAASLNLEDSGTQESRKAIEEQCVALADQAVIDAQSGGQIKDLARVQRGSPIFKLFTNFYSYFSATYNLNVEAYRRTDFKSPTEVGMFAVDMLILNTIPVLFSVALKELMKGGCQDDDIECLASRVAHEQVSFMMGQMVLLREAGAAVEVATGGDGFGYKGPAGLRFFGDLYSAGQQVGQGEADMAAFKAVNSVAGAVLHYPAGQINATLEGIVAVENGEVEGVSILPALISGKPRAEQ